MHAITYEAFSTARRSFGLIFGLALFFRNRIWRGDRIVKSELLGILRTPVVKGPKADASLILADQLIAAKLNIANGADATPVTSTITDANTVLSLYSGKLPYRVRTNSPNGHRMVNDAATLENYNKGLLTAGCSP